MTAELAFTIPGRPRTKSRPRTSARVVWKDGKPMAISTVHSDPEQRRLEAEVLRLFRARYPQHVPWTGPIMLRFTAVFDVPDSWPKALKEAAASGAVYHSGRPDKDNIEKLIVDALNGWAFVDDGQIQGGGVKRYGGPARIDVRLTLLSHNLPPTPSERNAERRVAEGKIGSPEKPRRSNPSKSGKPSGLQRAIDAALARDAGRR